MSLRTINLGVSRGATRILSDVSLNIEPGRIVGLLGANGAGKSTLLSALAGELTPDAGHIELDGTPLSNIPLRLQARQRAVLPQKPSLSFDLSITEVVAMGAYPFPELSPAKVTELIHQSLSLAGIAHLSHRRYPDLSGGEQQRVQFARILVQCHAPLAAEKSRYLLLDEPISNLDPKHQIELLRTTATLAHTKRLGVLVIVHDINLAARWCDQLVLLSQGTLIADGPPETVLTQDHLRKVYDIEADILPHPTLHGRILVLPH
jgi:iron complex transport system ATP-binding protein